MSLFSFIKEAHLFLSLSLSLCISLVFFLGTPSSLLGPFSLSCCPPFFLSASVPFVRPVFFPPPFFPFFFPRFFSFFFVLLGRRPQRLVGADLPPQEEEKVDTLKKKRFLLFKDKNKVKNTKLRDGGGVGLGGHGGVGVRRVILWRVVRRPPPAPPPPFPKVWRLWGIFFRYFSHPISAFLSSPKTTEFCRRLPGFDYRRRRRC